jgi:class 3 adenylate cyclase
VAESLHDVVLFIADISGYTAFMRGNAEALVHSQTVITRLLEAILDELRSPLEVSKLEGDAVFFYCLKPVPEAAPGEARAALGARLTAAREAFCRTVAELARSRYCDCDACRGIERLRVKFVAHSGRAVIHQVRRFQELAGVDVIVVHRLLENSVGANEYVLLTDACLPDVAPPAGWIERPVCESCEGVGEVSGRAWLPPEASTALWAERDRRLSLGTKLKHKARWTCGILRDEVLVRLGMKRRPDYRNVPAGAAMGLSDRLSGLTMLAVMPLLLPYTLLQNAVSVLAEHRADRANSGNANEEGSR